MEQRPLEKTSDPSLSDLLQHPTPVARVGRNPPRARRQGLDRTDLARRRGRLTGQVAVEPLVARVGEVERRDPVVVMPSDWVGDVRLLRAGEQDRDEPDAAGIIAVAEVVVNDPALPAYAGALAGYLLCPHAAAVRLGADQQDKVGRLEVPLHPKRPALRRQGGRIDRGQPRAHRAAEHLPSRGRVGHARASHGYS